MSTVAALILACRGVRTARFEMARAIARGHRDWILSTASAPIVTIVPLFLMLRPGSSAEFAGGAHHRLYGFQSSFVVWMMRSFFEEVPREIEESRDARWRNATRGIAANRAAAGETGIGCGPPYFA